MQMMALFPCPHPPATVGGWVGVGRGTQSNISLCWRQTFTRAQVAKTGWRPSREQNHRRFCSLGGGCHALRGLLVNSMSAGYF